MSYSYTTTEAFTRTHARHISTKIGADLRLLMHYYGRPQESEIEAYIDELTELLAGGYVAGFEAGFQRNGVRVLCLSYAVSATGAVTDGHAGGVPANVDVSGASWFTYLTQNGAWLALSTDEQARIAASLPVDRTPGDAPVDGDGYWEGGPSYGAGGVEATRRSFRSAA